jgi:VQ motif
MDSSSSGSLQSSSGGGGGGGNGTGSHEEEYTSGPNDGILSSFPPIINSSSQYDQYSFNYQDAFALNPNPSLSRSSLDSPWPSSRQLVPSCTNNNAQLLTLVTSASMQPPVTSENRPMATTNSAPTRGAKKRSRASRRPPTTVLTTDTSNFRAMVQEFTGFPAAPFVPASPFVRPRLSTGLGQFQSGSNSALGSPYLKPFPQKLQTNPSVAQSNLSSSTIVDAIASMARTGNLANLNTIFGTLNATSTSSSVSNTNFVNASTTTVATTSSIDPGSNFVNLHSQQASYSKYNFAAQGELDGLFGSHGTNPMRLECDGFERGKSRFASLESEPPAMEKGVFEFLNYADLKDKR